MRPLFLACVLTLLAGGAAAQSSDLVVAQGASGCVSQNTCFASEGNVRRIVFTSGCALSMPPGAWGEADLDCSAGGGNVPSTRTLTETYPLQCGGAQSCDLSANRTLSLFGAVTYVTDPQYAGGAKCDSPLNGAVAGTDDGPAIQAALNACVASAQTQSNRACTLYFPKCADGFAYNFTTPVVYNAPHSGATSVGAIAINIVGEGMYGPWQMNCGSTNACFKITQVAAIEWFRGLMQNVAVVWGNGTYTGTGTLTGPATAKYAVELSSSHSSWVVRDFHAVGPFVTDAVLHLLAGNFTVENYHDAGAISSGGLGAMILCDGCESFNSWNTFSYSEFFWGGYDSNNGSSTAFYYLIPSTVASASPRTQVKITQANLFGNTNAYFILSFGSTPLGSLDVEQASVAVNTYGVYFNGATSVNISDSYFGLSSARYIVYKDGAANVTVRNVRSSGFGVIGDFNGSGLIDVYESDLGPDSVGISGVTSPSGITCNTAQTVCYSTTAGIRSRIRLSQAAIVGSTLVKAGATDRQVDQLGTGDNAALTTGVAVDAASGANVDVRVVEALGQGISVKSDGAGTIAPGDPLTSSTSSAGRVVKLASTSAAVSVGESFATVAASADALVTGLLQSPARNPRAVTEFNLAAYNSANLAGGTGFAQFFVTNASTITAGGTVETQGIVGVGAGNFVTKLCSDGATCGVGNVYVTCTETCTATVGTTTSCTLTKSAVPAGTTLTQSVTTACATTNPAVNFNVHLTTP